MARPCKSVNVMSKNLTKGEKEADFIPIVCWRKLAENVANNLGKGETVHHIKHLKDRPDLGLTDSNLITVCYAHHNELHPEKQRQGKAKGKDKDKFVNEERW